MSFRDFLKIITKTISAIIRKIRNKSVAPEQDVPDFGTSKEE